MWTLQKCCLLLLAASTLTGAKPVAIRRTPGAVQDSDQLIQISIGLEPENRGRLEQTLFKVSNPDDPSYGRHLSQNEAKALLRPSYESTNAVKRWLSKAGISDCHISDKGQFIDVQLSMPQARSLLGPHSAALARPGDKGIQTTEATLPPEMRRHITAIYRPLGGQEDTRPPQLRPKSLLQHSSRSLPTNQTATEDVFLENCKSQLTPACLRKIYRIGDYIAEAQDAPFLGIAGFGGQAAQYDQLKQFQKLYAPYTIGSAFTVDLVNGGSNPQGNVSSGEANLDVQYAIALAHKLPVRFYSTGGDSLDFTPDLDVPSYLPAFENATSEPFLEFARHFLDMDDTELPRVISISYGINEQVLPQAYARQVCDIFGQLGARGVSVVAASGDFGPGQSCQSNDEKKTARFLPLFPASCPYVTSVGATQSNSPEVVVGFSSGGFSDYFDRPAWQDDAVGGYLSQHGGEWAAYYNPNGRGFPDVAALGMGYQIYSHNQTQTTGGTSASAPVFASIVGLLNDIRARDGKPSLGFLNPWIYRNGGRGYTDITQGKSVGCQGTSVAGLPSVFIPDAGWTAVPGWDPATGFGTPLFDELKDLL